MDVLYLTSSQLFSKYWPISTYSFLKYYTYYIHIFATAESFLTKTQFETVRHKFILNILVIWPKIGLDIKRHKAKQSCFRTSLNRRSGMRGGRAAGTHSPPSFLLFSHPPDSSPSSLSLPSATCFVWCLRLQPAGLHQGVLTYKPLPPPPPPPPPCIPQPLFPISGWQNGPSVAARPCWEAGHQQRPLSFRRTWPLTAVCYANNMLKVVWEWGTLELTVAAAVAAFVIVLGGLVAWTLKLQLQNWNVGIFFLFISCSQKHADVIWETEKVMIHLETKPAPKQRVALSASHDVTWLLPER